MILGVVLAGDLSDAEQRVWDAFPSGTLVDFGTGNEKDDDPSGGEGWGPDRRVGAEVLARLLCGAVDVQPGQAGEVYLARARVVGELGFPGVDFKHRLRLNECYVPDGIDLSEATTRTLSLRGCRVGAMHLASARITGTLSLHRAYVDGKGGRALTAQGLTVTGDMFCREGFQANGEIDLTGASIGGSLDFSGAHMDGKGGRALTAQGLTVTGDMFCGEGFQASGEINLLGASIGRQLIFIGAYLDGANGRALSAPGLTVTGGMLCRAGFQAAGEINLSGASIGGALDFSGARLDGKGGRALTARDLTVTASMFCRGGFQASGEIDLERAKIGTLADEKVSWPPLLNLDGLTYGDLTYLPARDRLNWLDRSAGYSPQPYEQLAGYYRRLGHDEQARRVLLAKQRQRRRERDWWLRWWGWLQDGLAGYGYAPGRALVLLAGAFVAGWVVFTARHPVPVGSSPHPAFNAALYTLDVLIPAPALGQASDFDPQGATLAVAAGLHILGWLLAITVIAAISRAFSRT
jgi:hypothetical protein